ncbi:phosphate signaling complex protein PhoU [Tolumonas lignilytica]|jgi:phosphate transport system regulatory protein PhoU|uniref:phosphate signaling complex protein PhoU n=1 Tax=Tolumonas lignilytica TaxID=1283284 RepID=UPI0004643F96|nr:phosphate signaling complex protein PhoU [Tolumonas lignilytica]
MEIADHVSGQFNRELNVIRNSLLAMGGIVEQQLRDSLHVLHSQDLELAHRIIEVDRQVNSMEVEINEACTCIIAKRQPAARDLRFIQIIIKTVSDLERIGNSARKVARLVRKHAGQPHILPQHLDGMSRLTNKMLHRALDAFARMDVEDAVKLYQEDAHVDEQYGLLIQELMNYMAENPRSIPQVLELIRCAHSIERIGDRCQNISDYIIYYVKGKDVRHTQIEDIDDLN